jgi:hypothetical protein
MSVTEPEELRTAAVAGASAAIDAVVEQQQAEAVVETAVNAASEASFRAEDAAFQAANAHEAAEVAIDASTAAIEQSNAALGAVEQFAEIVPTDAVSRSEFSDAIDRLSARLEEVLGARTVSDTPVEVVVTNDGINAGQSGTGDSNSESSDGTAGNSGGNAATSVRRHRFGRK